jgi:hypothetical protein
VGGMSNVAKAELATAQPATKAIRLTFIMSSLVEELTKKLVRATWCGLLS